MSIAFPGGYEGGGGKRIESKLIFSRKRKRFYFYAKKVKSSMDIGVVTCNDSASKNVQGYK
jgi:hypothetical protein